MQNIILCVDDQTAPFHFSLKKFDYRFHAKFLLGLTLFLQLVEHIRLMLHYVGEDYEDKMYECGPGQIQNLIVVVNHKCCTVMLPSLASYLESSSVQRFSLVN